MSLDSYLKAEGEVLICPFCQFPLTHNNSIMWKNKGQVGYDCFNCVVPEARTISEKPYSRYTIGVMENIHLSEDRVIGQIIAHETFVLPYKDKWYNVHNSLVKDQTTIVMVVPTQQEHVYDNERPLGLVHVGNIVYFPLIHTWNLNDQEATLEKIRTYLLFS